jgi:hypothetical protein
MTTAEMIEAGKTLKAKHRNSSRPHIGNYRVLHRDKLDPPEGTLTRAAGSNHSKVSGNAGVKGKVKTVGPRQRAYGPPWHIW